MDKATSLRIIKFHKLKMLILNEEIGVRINDFQYKSPASKGAELLVSIPCDSTIVELSTN